MLKSKRVQKIINDLKNYNISSYEIAKKTSLTQQGIDNIIKGKTEKPRDETLIEIENYISEKNSVLPTLERLENECIKHWEELKKRPLFAKQIEIEVLTAVNKSLEKKLKDME